MNVWQWVCVFLGGGLGSVCRFSVSRLVLSQSWEHAFPIATFTANLLSCLVMGFTLYLGLKADLSIYLKSFVLIGFCGGFSTFSTFSLETFQLMKTGDFFWALGNIIVSICSCVIVIWAFSNAE